MNAVFFDTSILLGGLIEMGPASRRAQEAMTAVAEGVIRAPLTAWHCCLEFYSVSTRLPTEFQLTPADALTLLESEVLARFRIHQLSSSRFRAFLRTAAAEHVAGGRLYDAHIAEIARRSGARAVVTENRRHFSTLARFDIPIWTADELIAQIRG